jgi:hypothetical protein
LQEDPFETFLTGKGEACSRILDKYKKARTGLTSGSYAAHLGQLREVYESFIDYLVSEVYNKPDIIERFKKPGGRRGGRNPPAGRRASAIGSFHSRNCGTDGL